MSMDGTGHTVLAFCPRCGEVRDHVIQDPGSCACATCGATQLIVNPLTDAPVAE